MTEDEYDAMIEAELRKVGVPLGAATPTGETGDAKIPVVCPGCGWLLMVPTRYAGRQVQCKKCDAAFVVKRGTPAAPVNRSGVARSANVGSAASAAVAPAKTSKFDPKGLVIALVTLLVPVTTLFLCCGGLNSGRQYSPSTESTSPSSEPAISGSADEVSETPGKAMVRRSVIVNPTVSESELRTLLMRHYREASAQSEFDYHQNPTVVAIYAYSSPAHEASGQWVGMLTKTPTDVNPQIVIHAAAGRPATNDERFGLTETQRKGVFSLIVQAEDRAWIEAERREPADPTAQSALSDHLVQRNRAELARRFGLTPAQLMEISSEGSRKNWPMPPGR